MAWQDRLRDKIILISPRGNEFSAFWQGDPRRMTKKLGIFNLPRTEGATVQDLGAGADLYTLTITFEGADHDLESDRFMVSAREIGKWQVTHPTKGNLLLQLVSVSEEIQPVRSGNITQIVTEWIEPLSRLAVKSLTQRAAEISNRIKDVDDAASDQFELLLGEGAFQHKGGAVFTAKRYLKIFTDTLAELAEEVAEISDRVSIVYRSIISTLSAPVIEAAKFAGQVQILLSLPLLVSDDVQRRMDVYKEFINRGIADIDLIKRTTDFERDSVASHELFLIAGLTALAQTVTTGTFETRPQAIDGIRDVSDLFSGVVNGLDSVQILLRDTGFRYQYFSQLDSFGLLRVVMAGSVDFILRSSFDLAVERKFVILTPRVPAEVVITEYGSLGEGDINLDNFTVHNNLIGQENLLLPEGRNVTVYLPQRNIFRTVGG